MQVTNANQQLYVTQLSMSSPFFVKQSEDYPDENAKKQWYKFVEADRKKIQAIRQGVNVIVDASCAVFYKLKISNDLSKDQITAAVADANQKMKLIDPTLHADVTFLPLQSEAFTSGTLLDNLTGQIREQIHGKVLARIQDTIEKNETGHLNNKTKTALLKMLDKCRGLNVIGDEKINDRIEQMKNQISNDQIVEMRDEILAILDDTKDRFASIDMVDTTSPGEVVDATTDPIIDETRYDAVPVTDDEPESVSGPIKKFNPRFTPDDLE